MCAVVWGNPASLCLRAASFLLERTTDTQAPVIQTWVPGRHFLGNDRGSLSLRGRQLTVFVTEGKWELSSENQNFRKCVSANMGLTVSQYLKAFSACPLILYDLLRSSSPSSRKSLYQGCQLRHPCPPSGQSVFYCMSGSFLKMVGLVHQEVCHCRARKRPQK